MVGWRFQNAPAGLCGESYRRRMDDCFTTGDSAVRGARQIAGPCAVYYVTALLCLFLIGCSRNSSQSGSGGTGTPSTGTGSHSVAGFEFGPYRLDLDPLPSESKVFTSVDRCTQVTYQSKSIDVIAIDRQLFIGKNHKRFYGNLNHGDTIRIAKNVTVSGQPRTPSALSDQQRQVILLSERAPQSVGPYWLATDDATRVVQIQLMPSKSVYIVELSEYELRIDDGHLEIAGISFGDVKPGDRIDIDRHTVFVCWEKRGELDVRREGD